ncbi:HpcH/HpaI aldolase [Ilyonectria destructans]|nr:HpcH/HpaI aldolase [Ilyonectria destructans]
MAPSSDTEHSPPTIQGATQHIAPNNLLSLASQGKICTAFGIKIIPGGEIVQIAKSAGYDSLFIDLEHRTLIRDAGAMGIIVPHIYTRRVSQFEYTPLPTSVIQAEISSTGSTVFIMIETADALAVVDDIAALPRCDVLVGSNDLASEIGTLPDWDHPKFIDALRSVGAAAKKHGKIMGIAGLYHRLDILSKVIYEFGAKWIVGA